MQLADVYMSSKSLQYKYMSLSQITVGKVKWTLRKTVFCVSNTAKQCATVYLLQGTAKQQVRNDFHKSQFQRE